MIAYVLELDNGYEYNDNEHWVEGVFKTYRGASDYLLNKGFKPYAVKNEDQKDFNDWFLCFEKEGGTDKNFEAWITDFEIKG